MAAKKFDARALVKELEAFADWLARKHNVDLLVPKVDQGNDEVHIALRFRDPGEPA
jgi:hypothetical protein